MGKKRAMVVRKSEDCWMKKKNSDGGMVLNAGKSNKKSYFPKFLIRGKKVNEQMKNIALKSLGT